MINERLVWYVEHNSILTNIQNGFQKYKMGLLGIFITVYLSDHFLGIALEQFSQIASSK